MRASIVDIPLGLLVTPRLPLVAFGCDMACVCAPFECCVIHQGWISLTCAPSRISGRWCCSIRWFQSCLVKEKSRIPPRQPFAVLDHILSSSLSSAANDRMCGLPWRGVVAKSTNPNHLVRTFPLQISTKRERPWSQPNPVPFWFPMP